GSNSSSMTPIVGDHHTRCGPPRTVAAAATSGLADFEIADGWSIWFRFGPSVLLLVAACGPPDGRASRRGRRRRQHGALLGLLRCRRERAPRAA
ncbi:MAG TPA: hypothetical protein VF874_04425, partial [Mycobacterium sp.]